MCTSPKLLLVCVMRGTLQVLLRISLGLCALWYWYHTGGLLGLRARHRGGDRTLLHRYLALRGRTSWHLSLHLLLHGCLIRRHLILGLQIPARVERDGSLHLPLLWHALLILLGLLRHLVVGKMSLLLLRMLLC